MEASSVDVSKIKVLPVTDYYECSHIDAEMARNHPLGSKRLIGNRMIYEIKYREYILGAMYFDKAVDRNKMRDTRIGWSPTQRRLRVKHIANNSRFLILPEAENIPNLASRALSLVSKRISEDWNQKYGIPLLALETYVDPDYNQNSGTCYKAAGWERLGLSTGYQAKGQERTKSKWYFLTPLSESSYAALSADIPHALLTGVKAVSGESNNNYVLDAGSIDLKELQSHLSIIPDHRTRHGIVYEFLPFLSLCIAAVFSGYTQYRQIADWVSKLPADFRVSMGLPGDRTPCESTVGEFLAAIDSKQLQNAINQWLKESYYPKKNTKHISLDGKSIRATSKDLSNQCKFLNVMASDLGIVINQLPTTAGGGEKITGIKALAEIKDLAEITVTADAIHTGKQFIDEVIKKTAHTC